MEGLPDEPLHRSPAADSQVPPASASTAEPAPPQLLPAKPVAGLLPRRASGGARGLAMFGAIEQVLDAVDAIADRVAELTVIRSRIG